VQFISGSPELSRTNLAGLLRLLHLNGPMRRAQLTRLTGLNRSTVGALVAELETLGVVEEGGFPAAAAVGRGRPSMIVRPRSEKVQVLAAEVMVGQASIALIGLSGTVIHRAHGRAADNTVHTMADLVADLVAELIARTSGRVYGLGISVPGVIRIADGNVRFAPNLGWHDQPFGELVSARLPGLVVRIRNDGDLGALAEYLRGAARGYDDVVFVAGETGVGSGVIVGGEPLLGAGGYAGELGHMSVREQGGRRCRCGAVGCWETEIGGECIAEALGLPADASHDEVVAVLRSKDGQPSQQLAQVAHYLGVGLASIVNLLNPGLIVLGGLLREIYPAVADAVRVSMLASALAAPAEQVTLSLPELGGDAVLLGAAEVIWQELLADPAATLAP
jgi:predicted NBD/HSP70 family sugar kinase